jgi:hypothetical protein
MGGDVEAAQTLQAQDFRGPVPVGAGAWLTVVLIHLPSHYRACHQRSSTLNHLLWRGSDGRVTSKIPHRRPATWTKQSALSLDII